MYTQKCGGCMVGGEEGCASTSACRSTCRGGGHLPGWLCTLAACERTQGPSSQPIRRPAPACHVLASLHSSRASLPPSCTAVLLHFSEGAGSPGGLHALQALCLGSIHRGGGGGSSSDDDSDSYGGGAGRDAAAEAQLARVMLELETVDEFLPGDSSAGGSAPGSTAIARRAGGAAPRGSLDGVSRPGLRVCACCARRPTRVYRSRAAGAQRALALPRSLPQQHLKPCCSCTPPCPG